VGSFLTAAHQHIKGHFVSGTVTTSTDDPHNVTIDKIKQWYENYIVLQIHHPNVKNYTRNNK